VLRLRDGERVVACDGAGSWRLCAVAPSGLDVLGEVVTEPEPTEPVAVWLPALKGERSEWAVQKLTELGVDEIGLLYCERAVVRLDDATAARVRARWSRVAREATCQSRRTRLPKITGPAGVAESRARGVGLCDLEGTADAESNSLAVGPEGGWGRSEAPARTRAVSLAPTVLRAETAAVAAAALLTHRRHAAARFTS
jgi:16S rRNA (uracil1498-N3)-methyltransferase